MDLLIDIHSGEVDALIPNLIMASMLKGQGVDVAVFLERQRRLLAECKVGPGNRAAR